MDPEGGQVCELPGRLTMANSAIRGQNNMIVDSHVYIFEPVDSPAGHASGREHLRWGQAAYAGHHQPAFRTRDRAPSDSSVLAPEGSSDIDEMPDKGFRFDHLRGRFVWDHNGEEHTKQYFLQTCSAANSRLPA